VYRIDLGPRVLFAGCFAYRVVWVQTSSSRITVPGSTLSRVLFRYFSPFKCSNRALSALCRLHRPRVGGKLSVLRAE